MTPLKRTMAQANFHRAGLESVIIQLAGKAEAILPCLAKGAFDLVFLDTDRSQYPSWWPSIRALLSTRGLLVVDNAISHHHELEDWMTEVAQDPGFQQLLLPIGKGEWLLVKNP
ncbi:O-methyltransferase [Aeromonas sp. BIGb0445]|uniref:O-methyltransferase n=1 Tax=Aeromonas sp. BIGb0445 TaxID=2940593 RepID=UPI002167938B|nr:hypothetical protein [Aeromonas sp. BIGb0445]MCS3458649.1 putative O-methyltransferase YrrM [Aeromonas sp. BIGb0445]